MKRKRISGVGLVILVAALFAVSQLMPASLVKADTVSGTLSVTAATNPRLTIAIDDTTVQFGSNLTPSGINSDSPDVVQAFTDTSPSNLGAYYVWKAASGNGCKITIWSNAVYDEYLQATENSGTSSTQTIASGALRYTEDIPPTSYAEAAAAAALTTTQTLIEPDQPPGVYSDYYFYALRVNWTDSAGTFVSTITYTVVQH